MPYGAVDERREAPLCPTLRHAGARRGDELSSAALDEVGGELRLGNAERAAEGAGHGDVSLGAGDVAAGFAGAGGGVDVGSAERAARRAIGDGHDAAEDARRDVLADHDGDGVVAVVVAAAAGFGLRQLVQVPAEDVE